MGFDEAIAWPDRLGDSNKVVIFLAIFVSEWSCDSVWLSDVSVDLLWLLHLLSSHQIGPCVGTHDCFISIWLNVFVYGHGCLRWKAPRLQLRARCFWFVSLLQMWVNNP